MIRLFHTKRNKLAGEPIPRGYRPAYYDVEMDRDICYPFGLHWIARFFRRIWERSMYCKISRLEEYGIMCRIDERKIALKEIDELRDEREAARRIGNAVEGWNIPWHKPNQPEPGYLTKLRTMQKREQLRQYINFTTAKKLYDSSIRPEELEEHRP